jgi:hypothetical protein
MKPRLSFSLGDRFVGPADADPPIQTPVDRAAAYLMNARRFRLEALLQDLRFEIDMLILCPNARPRFSSRLPSRESSSCLGFLMVVAMILFTRTQENWIAGRARVVWGIVCSLFTVATLGGWFCYARLSRSAEFVEGRFNYRLLEDPRCQDIVWDRCDPLQKNAELKVSYTSGDTAVLFLISIVHGTEGTVHVFPAAGAADAKAAPLAAYRYHQRELTATQNSLAPEDRAFVQRTALAICEVLRKSL